MEIYSDNSFQYLTPEDIEGLLQVIRDVWPSHMVRVRSFELLDSAIHRPMNGPLGLGIFDLAAMYFESFEGNQALTDGNKRLAFFAVNLFLESIS